MGGLAFAIKKLNLWNEGQSYSNVKLENRAGGLVYDWDFVALFFKLYPQLTLEYLEDYSGFGIVHFRKFIKDQPGFNSLLRKWRKARRPMDDNELRQILALSSAQKLASTKSMIEYMNKHKEWDEEAMKQFETRVETKKKVLEMEGLDITHDSNQSDESQDSTLFDESPPSKKRKASHLASLEIPDDRSSDYDSVLNSPNAMPLKKRRLWSSSPSPSPTPSKTLSPSVFASPRASALL